MKKQLRIVAYPEDVCNLTGKSISYARKAIASLKKLLNKKPHQFVTLDEIGSHLGLPQEQIEKYRNTEV
jgi:hypothetical protein